MINSRKMVYSETEPRWIKFGAVQNLAFIGKEVVASASGLYMRFYHINTKEERVERLSSEEKGEGVSCWAGHPVVPMFAIAEKRQNPRILILTYPRLKRVAVCVQGVVAEAHEYLDCAFVDTDYLITLSSFPNFQIVVWLWRTGEKLIAKNTRMKDQLQRLNCSVMSSRMVSQLGITSGKLLVYEISVCSKIVSIMPVEINPIENKKLVSVSWTPDGGILFCDQIGNVWWMSSDGKKRYTVVEQEECNKLGWKEGKKPLIAAFQGGVVLVDTDSKIRFYKRPSMEYRQNEELWDAQWEVVAISHPTAIAAHPLKNNIFFHGEKGDLIEINVDEENVPRLEVVYSHGAGYRMLVWIYPGMQGILAIDKFNQMTVFEPSSGESLGKLSLAKHGKVLCMVSHPDIPIIAIGTDIGKCLFVNLLKLTEPILLTSFHLHGDPLDRVKYSYSGRTLVVASLSYGQFFFIKGKPGDQMDVLSHLQIKRQVVDFLLYEHDGGLKLLILVVSSTFAIIGDTITIYTLKNGQSIFLQEDYTIELSNAFKSLHYSPENVSNIIGAPYLTKQLHLMEIKENFQGISLIHALPSGHQLRSARINADRYHTVTSGYDGLVVVRDGNSLDKVLAIYMAHHRKKAGVKFAVVSPCSDLIVTLGKNGNLVATKLSYVEPNLEIVRQANLKLVSPEMQRMFSSPTSGFIPEEADEGKTWIECQEAMKLRREEEISKADRASIIKDIKKLRVEVTVLLDANEEEDEEERLPIAKFDLDEEERERRVLMSQSEREKAKVEAEELMQRQDEIADFLRKTCWQSDPTVVHAHARSVKAIFGNTHVDNYPLLATSEQQEDEWRWTEFVKNLSTEAAKLDASYSRDPILDREEKELGRAIEFDLKGTTTDRWVGRDPQHFTQMETYNYIIGVQEAVFIQREIHKLKGHFNNRFEEMMSIKEREMSMVGNRIAALQHIASELQSMFQTSCHRQLPELPVWDPMEKPETLIKVEDWEVYAKPYVSPREQEERAKQAAEAERIRLILLADNFRELALMDMMDGVLEVRWEDEIKKDVPEPACLMGKNPSDYTEEDTNAIAVYEAKVQVLTTEREKYKHILESDFVKTTGAMKDGIRRFNERLDEFFIEKMKLESAVLQEKLCLIRSKRRELDKTRRMDQVSDIRNNELVPALKRFQKLTEELSLLEETIVDVKNRYDAFCKREKMLEMKFRSEFPDLKGPMVEHLSRHYKRRPRMGTLTCTSITYLMEIEKCVTSGEKSEILPRECLDFLKGMDSLDVMPNSLPAQIDFSHWQHLCKLRRIKVEMEMKVKCCAVEVAEAEQTVASYQKLSLSWQNQISQVKETLKEHRAARLRFAEDTEVQLVLKMGQVEAHLQGLSGDLVSAVLVSANQLYLLNEAIVEAGQVKLNAMKRTVDFRRVILYKEWQHRYMQMALQDLREELKVLKKVKVTKEVQDYLKRRAENLKEKDIHSLEKEMESMKGRFQRIADEEKHRVDELGKQVDYWKKENASLDKRLESLNVKNCEESSRLRVQRELLDKEGQFANERIGAVMKRTRLVKTVQDNYNQLLNLRTELELLRLKTYPTLRFKSNEFKQ